MSASQRMRQQLGHGERRRFASPIHSAAVVLAKRFGALLSPTRTAPTPDQEAAVAALEAARKRLRGDDPPPRADEDGVMSHADEYGWTDDDDCRGRVIGYHEVRLEQPGCPADAAALIDVGSPPRPHPNGIDSVIDANPIYLTAEQAVDAALTLLDAAAMWRCNQESDDGPPTGPVSDDDHDRRWRLHVHACSVTDSTFWVERHCGGWKATEVETGVTGPLARSVEEAMAHYFAGHVWGDAP